MRLIDMTISEFSDTVDSNAPAPGGGSVAALASNIGIGLARMMAHLSFGKRQYEALDKHIRMEFIKKFNNIGDLKHELLGLVDEDTRAFNGFMKALKMPKESEEEKRIRKKAIQNATIYSIEVPLEAAKLSLKALENLDLIVKYGNKNAITDVGVGVLMIYTGIEGAILNVKVNLSGLDDTEFSKNTLEECRNLLFRAKEIKDSIVNNIQDDLDAQLD